MDVVRRLVVFLICTVCPASHPARGDDILTALVEDTGAAGRRSAAAQAVFDIDEDVGEISTSTTTFSASFAPLHAGILAHVDLRRLRWPCHQTSPSHLRSPRLQDQSASRPGRWLPAETWCYWDCSVFSFLFASRSQQQAAQSQQCWPYPPTCFLFHDVVLSSVVEIIGIYLSMFHQTDILTGEPPLMLHASQPQPACDRWKREEPPSRMWAWTPLLSAVPL